MNLLQRWARALRDWLRRKPPDPQQTPEEAGRARTKQRIEDLKKKARTKGIRLFREKDDEPPPSN